MKKIIIPGYKIAIGIVLFLFFFRTGNLPAQCPGKNNTPRQSVRFGVIADIQFADKDSNNRRFYRTSIQRLRQCVTDLNAERPAFAIQLGDIIDGHKENPVQTHRDLDAVIGVINQLSMPLYHVIGNHDMTAGREYLGTKLGMRQFYYDFSIPAAKGWRFIVLDGNDGGYGIMSDSQIAWLKETLNEAETKKERVICFCHYALIPDSTMHHYMAKPEPVLEILDNSRCVKAWFAGHDHGGGYTFRNKIHYLTFKGMIEAPLENSYALVELCEGKILIIGKGKEVSRELPLIQKVSRQMHTVKQ
ncbi:MAG: metallophosphoesterase [Mangrovibacterium sp.]|nr:metallophosphoesterase [Mangrovibacterium sp.]